MIKLKTCCNFAFTTILYPLSHIHPKHLIWQTWPLPIPPNISKNRPPTPTPSCPLLQKRLSCTPPSSPRPHVHFTGTGLQSRVLSKVLTGPGCAINGLDQSGPNQGSMSSFMPNMTTNKFHDHRYYGHHLGLCACSRSRSPAAFWAAVSCHLNGVVSGGFSVKCPIFVLVSWGLK